MLVDEEAVGPSRSPKRTVCCFGEGKPLYLLTLIQGSTILTVHKVYQTTDDPSWSV